MRLRVSVAAALCMTVVMAVSEPIQAVEPNRASTDARQWIGLATLCEGTATLVRDGKSFKMLRGSGILSGDKIETDHESRITMTMNGGPSITLAPLSQLSVKRVGQQWNLVVTSGQTRVVHDGETDFRLSANDSVLWIGRAIVQVESADDQTRFEVTAGSIEFESTTVEPVRIVDRGAYASTVSSGLEPISHIGWELSGSQVQLAAAMQTTPNLQPPTTILPPDSTEATQLQTQSPSDLSQLDPPVPLNEDAQFDENIPVDEDDDELPQFAQDPAAAGTRAGTDDGLGVDSGIAATTNTFGGNSSLSLGSLSSASGTFFSGGLFSDAGQQTFQGQLTENFDGLNIGDPFPGAIHLVTAETRLPFSNVQLSSSEFAGLFPATMDKFFSIGTGSLPTGQVLTNFFTGTSATPNVIDVPRFNVHLIELDQYNIPDPAQGALDSNIGLTGLIGPSPTGPTVVGAAPLADTRAKFNQEATFALGEFLVTSKDFNGNPTDGITFTVRRSDQDRLIVKDPGGNDANDFVTPNTDVVFDDAADPRFLPQSPTVKVPDSVANTGTGIADLNLLRRAAFTTLVADQLQDYSRRTGQTRFVVDGKIVDISGFRPTNP